MSTPAHAAARDQTLERVLREFEALTAQLPDEIMPRVLRRRAAEQLRQLGWPQARDEQWRYTNLRAFERLASFAPARLLRAAATGMGASDAALSPAGLPEALPGIERLLFIDGVRANADIRANAAAPATALPLPLPGGEAGWSASQRLGLLTDMFAQDGAVLRIRGEAALELLFVNSPHAAGGAVYPRVQIELAADSRLTLVERHLDGPGASVEPGEAALVGAATSIELGRGSQLTHYRLQQCGPHTLFSDSLTARLQEQASYQVCHLALGSAHARTSARVRLVGRGASFCWQAIAVGRAEQVRDTTLEVEHAAAGTRTDEVFRGIAEERARLAFSGQIHVQASAPGAEARQSLRGLIEGAGSEIDLRPRLQIDTDEVSAQHGATTGRLDEQLLFYLLTRGLDRSTARALLKWAFLGDVLRAIELPGLRAQLERDAAGQLHDVLAVGALPTEHPEGHV